MLRTAITIAALLLTSISYADDTEQNCTYCGGWLPIPDQKSKTPGKFFLVSTYRIALPGCNPVDATLEVVDDNVTYIRPDTANLKALRAVYSSDKMPKCRQRLPTNGHGFVLLLELNPRGIDNGEEMTASLFERTALKEVIRAGTPIDSQAPKSKSNRYRLPKLIDSWWLIRWDHNPCDEGTPHGFQLCEQL